MTETPKLERYGRFNSWDAMKLLALALMFIDHIGYFFFPHQLMWRAPGRGAAIIFLFLTGYAPAHRLKPDLVFMAIAMWGVNILAGGDMLPLGMLCSIVFGRWMVGLIDSGWLKLRRPQEWIALFIFFSPVAALLFSYGTHGLALVLSGYMQQHRERFSYRMRAGCFICALIFYGLIEGFGLDFNAAQALVATFAIGEVGTLLWGFRVQPVTLPAFAAWAEPGLRLLSRYSLWIYVLHFGGLQLALHKSF